MTPRKKPTRRDLLIVIGRLQDLVGQAFSAHGSDRNPNGFEQGQKALQDAHRLCIEARSFDEPLDGASSPQGWS